jgi:plasmid stabilization system protein ParE
MRVVLRPAAAADIEEAFSWYQRHRVGFGDEFLTAVQSALETIGLHPARYPIVYRDTHRALLRRFPYGVIYRIYDDVVVVVACMHGRRDPRRWKTRR